MSYLLLGGHASRRQPYVAELDDLKYLGRLIEQLPAIDGNQPCIYSLCKLPSEARKWHMAAKVEHEGELAEMALVFSFTDPWLIRDRKDYDAFVTDIGERLAKHNFKLVYLMSLSPL